MLMVDNKKFEYSAHILSVLLIVRGVKLQNIEDSAFWEILAKTIDGDPTLRVDCPV